MEKALTDDEYLVRKFAMVMSVAGRLQKVCCSPHTVLCTLCSCVWSNPDTVTQDYRRNVRLAEDFEQFLVFAKELAKEIHDAVLVDQVICQVEEKERLLELLKRHIFFNLVGAKFAQQRLEPRLSVVFTHALSRQISIGGKIHLQKVGISQGSILSALLCGFVYIETITRRVKIVKA